MGVGAPLVECPVVAIVGEDVIEGIEGDAKDGGSASGVNLSTCLLAAFMCADRKSEKRQ